MNIAKEIMSMPYAQRFVSQAQAAFDKLLLRAPSDGFMSMETEKEGSLFRTKIKLASGGLRFALVRTAQSPFMALEYAVKEAFEKIQVWSLLREKDQTKSSR